MFVLGVTREELIWFARVAATVLEHQIVLQRLKLLITGGSWASSATRSKLLKIKGPLASNTVD